MGIEACRLLHDAGGHQVLTLLSGRNRAAPMELVSWCIIAMFMDIQVLRRSQRAAAIGSGGRRGAD